MDLGSFQDAVYGHRSNLTIKISLDVSSNLAGLTGGNRRLQRPGVASLVKTDFFSG